MNKERWFQIGIVLLLVIGTLWMGRYITLKIYGDIDKACKNTNDTIDFPQSSTGKLDCYQWNIKNMTTEQMYNWNGTTI